MPRPQRLAVAISANALILVIAAYAWAIVTLDSDFYYLSVQEDEYLEWASFWAFLGAAIVFLRSTLRPGFASASGWFLLGLAALCLFVALEEISWGQRLIGYRPPEYFLATNYQQEFNVHNIAGKGLRQLALQVVIFGYGVALPVGALSPAVSDALRRAGIVAPPAALIPAFVITGVAQATYPLKFTGEWVELMLGLCFLFTALLTGRDGAPAGRLPPATRLLVAWLVVVAAGFASAAATRYQRDADPDRLAAAHRELEALRRDVVANQPRSRCGRHKRLYTYAGQYAQRYLFTGEFARLTNQGLPEARAAYLLDPWNYAYWLRDNCATADRERMTYLYSFGPNRRRDSTKWEIRGDDVAVFLRGEPRRGAE